MVAPTFEDVARQLSKGLDLCVRARKLDAQERTNAIVEICPGADLERLVPRMNAMRPEHPHATRSATIPVWIQDQYDRDLMAWENETRAMLSHLPLHVLTDNQSKEGGA